MLLKFKLKRLPVFLTAFVLMTSVAYAGGNTFSSELERIGKLRKVFGDPIVNALTNLPPDQYFDARDQALVLAEQVNTDPAALAEARKSLCDKLAKQGVTCHEVAEQPEPVEPAEAADSLSAVSKPEPELEAVPEPQIESAEAPAPASAPAVASNEPQLESDTPPAEEFAPEKVSDPVAEAQKSQAPVPSPTPTESRRASLEPTLESDQPTAAAEPAPETASAELNSNVSVEDQARQQGEPDLSSDSESDRHLSSE